MESYLNVIYLFEFMRYFRNFQSIEFLDTNGLAMFFFIVFLECVHADSFS